jgi:hypothetical protein
MARSQHEHADVSLALDDGSAPRRTPPATRRSIAVLAVVLAFGAVVALKHADSSSAADVAANSVRAVGDAPALGPDPGLVLDAGLVDVAAASNRGYWIAAADGGVFAEGDAHFYGSAHGLPLAGPVVAIASPPGGKGYWLAAADGGVFTFGSRDFYGSLGGYQAFGAPLTAPIVAIAATPTGRGYWLLGGDGGVFAFGDAEYLGSAAGRPYPTPFVGIAGTKSGRGYYLLEADGGVFAFGDAHFSGAPQDGQVAAAIAARPSGRGYQVARVDGSIVGFGGASSTPAPPDAGVNEHPVVGIAARPAGGAWLARGYVPPAPPPPNPSTSPFLACTRAHESDSAGGYAARSPDGLYYGAYQFLRSTWDSVARESGRLDLVGRDPATVAPADQDQLALNLYHWQGAAPWGGRCAGLP